MNLPSTDASDQRKDFVKIVRGLLHSAQNPTAAKGPEEKIVDPVTWTSSGSEKLRIKKTICPLTLSDFSVVIQEDHIAIAGGGGIVFKCVHSDVASVNVALKVTRPSLYGTNPDQFEAEVEKSRVEFRKGLPLSHQNVVKTLMSGLIRVSQKNPAFDPATNVPVMLAEWIDGATDLYSYLTSGDKRHTHHEMLRIIMEIMSGLGHLHENGLVHWDMKADNILVSGEGQIKIADLGNARFLSTNQGSVSRNDEVAQSSLWNLPPVLAAQADGALSGISVNRINLTKPANEYDTPWLDLWMVAKELNRFFLADLEEIKRDEEMQERLVVAATAAKKKAKIIYEARATHEFLEKTFPYGDEEAAYYLEIIRVIIKRLLCPKTPTADAYYRSAHEVLHDLSKASPEYGASQGVEELRAVPQHSIRLPRTVHGNDAFTKRFEALIDSAPIQRLKRHRQLATVGDVYPGGVHTRFEHSVGVFHATIEYIRALYSDRTSCFWRLSSERSDTEALLVAALFHDSGHYSFAHYIEDIKGIYRGCRHEDYAAAIFDPDFESALSPFLVDSLQSDRNVIQSVFIHKWGMGQVEAMDFGKKVAAIIKPNVLQFKALRNLYDKVNSRAGTTYAITMICHSIIDSAIDADKLDYLGRDGHHAGVKYTEGIDERRFFASLTTVVEAHDIKDYAEGDSLKHPTICITSKGILPALSILTARFFMFSCMYWQKTVRAETSMLQHAIVYYIANQPDSNGAELAMAKLVKHFLENDENNSLKHLESLLVGLSIDRKAANMCRILVEERSAIYKAAYELGYSKSQDPKEAFKTIDGLIHELRADATAWEAAIKIRDFKKKYAGHVTAYIYRVLQKEVTLGEHDLIVDVPPQGKDLVGNAFVRARGGVVPIQQLNPIADAIDDSFRLWVRTLRVFVSKDAIEQCRARDITDTDLENACRAGIVELYPQGRLLFA